MICLPSAIQVQYIPISLPSLFAVLSVPTFWREDNGEVKELGIQGERRISSGEGRMRIGYESDLGIRREIQGSQLVES